MRYYPGQAPVLVNQGVVSGIIRQSRVERPHVGRVLLHLLERFRCAGEVLLHLPEGPLVHVGVLRESHECALQFPRLYAVPLHLAQDFSGVACI